MGESLFQICYEGDLTVEVSEALRYMSAEPNFDRSWQVLLPDDGSASILLHELEGKMGGNARILVARTWFSRNRDYLLIRHSTTPGADYRELHSGMARLGTVMNLPFEATFVVDTRNRLDVQMIGEVLSELCPDESLMVVGISRDFAYSGPMVTSLFAEEESKAEPRSIEVLPDTGFEIIR